MSEMAQRFEAATKPHWAILHGEESGPGEPVRIDRVFFVVLRARAFMGAAAVDGSRAAELIPVLQKPMFSEPGTFGFVNQPSIFGRGIGSGRRIDLDISGPDLEVLLEVAGKAVRQVATVMPFSEGNQLRPNPGLELGAPEVRVVPNRLRLADNGITAQELAESIDAANDGLRVTEVSDGSSRIDLTLMGPRNGVSMTQGIGSLPVVTPAGAVVPVSQLADIIMTAGPTELRHRERERTITIEVRPAPGVPLEAALDKLRAEVMEPLEEEGLPPDVKLGLSGTADQLAQTWDAMVVQLALALVIVYLVMAVLFESFIYPLVILLSVPVATVGGIVGLALLNLTTYQPLDMLTLLGFVILIGIVVNNAILIVHQALHLRRERGLAPREAVATATRNRLRPIFMSTLTSVFGMLPLVLFPGAGSELYRGLGTTTRIGDELPATGRVVFQRFPDPRISLWCYDAFAYL
jgi:HAE1 family hydrophobic/amphiphilic exporter-1